MVNFISYQVIAFIKPNLPLSPIEKIRRALGGSTNHYIITEFSTEEEASCFIKKNKHDKIEMYVDETLLYTFTYEILIKRHYFNYEQN